MLAEREQRQYSLVIFVGIYFHQTSRCWHWPSRISARPASAGLTSRWGAEALRAQSRAGFRDNDA